MHFRNHMFFRFIVSELNNSGNLPRSPSTQQTRTSSYTSRWLETTAQSYLRYNTNVDFTPLLFHSLCGKNTKLSDAGTIASREKDEYCNAYAFTSRPLKCGENIVVQVLGVDRSFVGGLAFGFTSCDPSTLAPRDLPDDSDLLLDRLEYWVVNKDVCRSPDLTDELSFHLTEEGKTRMKIFKLIVVYFPDKCPDMPHCIPSNGQCSLHDTNLLKSIRQMN